MDPSPPLLSPGVRQPTPQPLWRTAVALSVLQLILHVVAAVSAVDPRMVVPHAVAWGQDVLLLGTLTLVLSGLLLVAGRARRAVVGFGVAALVALGLPLAVYPQLLQAFLAAPANLFEADSGTARIFLQDYLGLAALWPAALALGVGALAPRARFLRVDWRWTLVGGPIALLALLALARDAPNPVLYAVQSGARQVLEQRQVPRLDVGGAGRARSGSSSAETGASLLEAAAVDWSGAAQSARYAHVLVVVLEGVTAADFEASAIGRPGGFLDRHRHHARTFSRYHATNLDSYTSLIAMTTSVQVPFRAYAAPEQYEPVNGAPNLVRGLGAAGFRTLFISTYEHQPFVPNAWDWGEILDRQNLGDLSAWVSLGTNRMESATEDRAALPTVLAAMTASPRSLVMAELVFGHSPEWRARTGKTPLEYAEVYLSDLWDLLTRAELAARTLLIVVSDHGDRSRPADPKNYRVPLFVVGGDVAPGNDDAFRTHLDLQRLVAHFLLGAALPPPRERMLLVGSTERWVYGELRDDGGHLFIDDRSGRVLAGNLETATVHASFGAHLSAFTAAFALPPR